MFDGVINQLRPWAHHCSVEFNRLMAQLGKIEQAIKDGAKESEFGDRIIRVMQTAAVSQAVSLGPVPIDQLWVLDFVWADQAGWTLTLGGAPRFGPTNMSTANGQLVMLPGEEWFFQAPASITNFMVQLTRQLKPEHPNRARSGAGFPEGLTTAQGPPLHELGRDAQSLPTPSR
jgi:hypothetical protein